VLEPCGFDWKMDVGLLAGAGAKELVASTMGVLYSNNADAESSELSDNIRAEGITPLSSLAYLLFVLIYFPCIATITAIKNETGRWSWAIGICAYTIVVAWLTAFIGFHIAALLV
jgi:ferrous iron transport protein B